MNLSSIDWVMVVLVCVAWQISVGKRAILEKLENIESQLDNINAGGDRGSHDDDFDDSES